MIPRTPTLASTTPKPQITPSPPQQAKAPVRQGYHTNLRNIYAVLIHNAQNPRPTQIHLRKHHRKNTQPIHHPVSPYTNPSPRTHIHIRTHPSQPHQPISPPRGILQPSQRHPEIRSA
ncbi:hypothetical protein BO70DRAFT_139165 [Aspergillus heteromorphus CBS 117.55]|uniref:Uncharacterized protein n=1 Tax=Aspergillus heteromorphus CBS 117.55 TaxID=1448321 RepID=A0A317VBP0_9EURO|nr:uncharacterized protein BO70DRAFT_139165 [Aspergillus heteromorphus CBS 117.55]PWY70487.1 hypothetical protein BO70DRAFT_139165 [Aspergillus heteromorphus CBS 117.55]